MSLTTLYQQFPNLWIDNDTYIYPYNTSNVFISDTGSIGALVFDTNIAAAGVTLSGTTLSADGTDDNINIAITPKGTGEVDITKVDIDNGTIDGCTISTSNITVGAGYTFDVSAGTLTLANDQISGDKVEGGTIAGITINDLVVSTSLGIGVVSPCSLVELWDDDAHPILSITAAHATDYDPQIQFRTDVTDTVKCSMGVDSGDSDKFKIYMGSGIGGTSQFVIDSSGNVIVGGSTAQTLMTISGAFAYLSLWNTSEEDTDGGCETRLNFMGEHGGGTRATYARIQGSHDGSSQDNKGDLIFFTNDGTDGDSPTEVMRIDSSGLLTHLNAFLCTGTTGSTPVSGAGTRLMWIPSLYAFRAGRVTGTSWDAANIGTYSFACGLNTTASANASFCAGLSSTASGAVSTCFGGLGTASGTQSTCFGNGGTASGLYSTHFGSGGVASGSYSTCFGYKSRAGGDFSWAGGSYMQLSASADCTFVFGYSASSAITIDASNAFILYGVNVGIGEIDPETKIEMTHTSPFFTFHCDTESDATDSGMCKLLFKREQSGGEETTHAAIYAAHDGASDDQKGYIALCTNDGSDGNAPTEAMRIDSLGNVGIGVTSPTAYLHVKAGTATAGTAPVKLTNGTLLGTPEAGAIEYSLEKFWITNVSTQRVIDRSSCVITETTTVTNTTDETEIYNCPIVGNALRAGNHVHVGVSGLISNDSAADDITVRLYIGSTLISTYNPAIGNITDADWHAEIQITTRSIGATGSVAVHGHVIIDDNEDHAISVETVDTTATCDLSITVEWDNAKATNIISAILGASHWSN